MSTCQIGFSISWEDCYKARDKATQRGYGDVAPFAKGLVLAAQSVDSTATMAGELAKTRMMLLQGCRLLTSQDKENPHYADINALLRPIEGMARPASSGKHATNAGYVVSFVLGEIEYAKATALAIDSGLHVNDYACALLLQELMVDSQGMMAQETERLRQATILLIQMLFEERKVIPTQITAFLKQMGENAHKWLEHQGRLSVPRVGAPVIPRLEDGRGPLVHEKEGRT
jgi:hypothetical protein